MPSKLLKKVKGLGFQDWVVLFVAAGMAINTVLGKYQAATLNALVLVILFLAEINVVLYKILLELIWLRKKL